MELGCDGVLMNTAIAEAKDPVMMAAAMKAAVEAGRLAYRAGRMAKRMYADPRQPAGRADLGRRRVTAFADAREAMVTRQIAARGIDDPALLAAFRAVPRELFVAPEQAR